MFTNFVGAVKRYSGYARFVSPVWAAYVGFVAAHPKVAAVAIVVLTVFAVA